MFSATDCASKLSRWIGVSLGLCLALSEVGCAKLNPFGRPEPPMLGSAAPFGDTANGGGDYYAQQIGRGADRSRELLAQQHERERKFDADRGMKSSASRTVVRSTGRPTMPPDGPTRRPTPGRVGSNGPLEVALQPPVSESPAVSTPARRPATAAAPAPASPRDSIDLASTSKPLNDRPADVEAATSDDESAEKLESVLAESRKKLNSLSSYQVTIKRQERVGETLQPAEEALLSIRRNPKAVRLEWPTGPHKGREVIYATGDGDGLLHVNMADSLVPMVPLALAPDSPLAMRNSRHPISEAGFDNILENIEKNFKPASTNKAAGKVTYQGTENPGQLKQPSHKIVRVTPTGETWVVYIDPDTMFPVMVQATSAKGDLLERYLFVDPKTDVAELASADAFDHNKRWAQTGGFLQRLARAGGSKPAEEKAAQ
ncbi:DUF1571 domain-containing protein [Singulisphaera sp. PoT]|uniref:DUF1571 domain-containing protein n=1 Tax=Singulisphaera sp. PoT TaxID=3411797 RepID=UPI003BF52D2E